MVADADAKQRYCLFPTAIGLCGVAWNGQGALTHLQLPEASDAATKARLARHAGTRSPSEPPEPVAAVIADLKRYLEGEAVDFSGVAIDVRDAPPFHRRAFEVARSLGHGETATYGEVARLVGAPEAARAVGQAMAHNPLPIIIPCHRVLASGNRIGGFSAYGGAFAKERLLEIEGVRVSASGLTDTGQGEFRFE